MMKKTAILTWMILTSTLVQQHVRADDPVASGQLAVLGAGLDVSPASMTVPVGVPSQVQTIFSAGLAKPPAGMLVKASLYGPGINGAMVLTTLPGHPLTLP
ncbi:MAG: hypothetical protein HYX75_12395, partial [Acidobacteria bacterium]|nr:hypothetical protein [Acidobacteriota bacterium]